MMRRCYSKKAYDRKYYGGRGIGVCKRWHKFIVFYEDMKKDFVKGLSIDRVDVNGDYSKENCRWISMKEQFLNRRSNHHIINPKTGESKTIQEWSEVFGLKRATINSRILRGHKDFDELMHKGHLKTYKFEKLTRQVAD
jgi:hypothetical protein